MNFTTDYHDELDGDFLACKPDNIAKGLDVICNIGIPFVATSNLVNGLWLFYLTYTQRHYRILLNKRQELNGHVPSTRNSHNVRPQNKVTGVFSYMEKLLLTCGVVKASGSVQGFMYGAGTIYPTTHIRGQIGDVAFAICFATWWYMSLLQHRGAVYFKSLIPQPQKNICQEKQPTRSFHMPSLSTTLDATQSWLAPLIGLVLWLLLRFGIYTRGWFVFYIYTLSGIYGFRTFNSTVYQRLATLKHVTHMVNSNTTGTVEEVLRRRAFLRKQLFIIVINLTFVFFFSVILTTSMIFLGSTFDSQQMAIHAVVLNIPVEIMASLTNLYTHFALKKKIREAGVRSGIKSLTAIKGNSKVTPSTLPKGMSLPAGSSVVEQSDV